MKLTPTPEELAAVKLHFQKQGYGVIRDETAAAQTDLIRLMRKGQYKPEDYEGK